MVYYQAMVFIQTSEKISCILLSLTLRDALPLPYRVHRDTIVITSLQKIGVLPFHLYYMVENDYGFFMFKTAKIDSFGSKLRILSLRYVNKSTGQIKYVSMTTRIFFMNFEFPT